MMTVYFDLHTIWALDFMRDHVTECHVEVLKLLSITFRAV